MAHLSSEERQRGVVTASTGNHGQSIAYAAQLFGARAVIVVPEGANPVKVEAMRSYGAAVVFYGADFAACKRHCLTLQNEQGLRFISSGDEPLLLAGVATHTLEIIEARPDVEVIIVPIGGGSGAAGAWLSAKSINPAIQVITVQASAAPAAYLTWKHGAGRASAIHRFPVGQRRGAHSLLVMRLATIFLVAGRAVFARAATTIGCFLGVAFVVVCGAAGTLFTW